jgi:hypothetical protein
MFPMNDPKRIEEYYEEKKKKREEEKKKAKSRKKKSEKKTPKTQEEIDQENHIRVLRRQVDGDYKWRKKR